MTNCIKKVLRDIFGESSSDALPYKDTSWWSKVVKNAKTKHNFYWDLGTIMEWVLRDIS